MSTTLRLGIGCTGDVPDEIETNVNAMLEACGGNY